MQAPTAAAPTQDAREQDGPEPTQSPAAVSSLSGSHDPTPQPVPAGEPRFEDGGSPDVVGTSDNGSLPAEQTSAELADDYESVQASVVPVPMETFNRLVLAVDKLAVELTTVQRAIRDLTSILTDSLRSAEHTPSTLAHAVRDHQAAPIESVPAPTAESPAGPSIFGLGPTSDHAASESSLPPTSQTAPPAEAFAPTPPSNPVPAPDPVAVPESSFAAPSFEVTASTEPVPAPEDPPLYGQPLQPSAPARPDPVSPEQAAPVTFEQPAVPLAPMPDRSGVPRIPSMDDVPLVSVGEVQVLLGPVSTLAELDDIDQRIRALQGVNEVSVTAFEGREVLLTLELARPIPLASVLRTELGRDVISCRVVDGRIAVEFDEGPPVA